VTDEAMPPSIPTSVEKAYEFLRRMAIEFEIKPGERLNEGAIARHLRMSRAPVREAMNRLVSEDLLTVIPNQGFSCRRLSASEVVALYEVRGDLEATAVGRALPYERAQGLAELSAMCASLRRALKTDAAETLVDLDEAFHLRLAGLSGNLERIGMLKNINARVRFVRRINLEDPVRAKRALDEHLGIVAALKAGNLDEAAQLTRRHLTLSAAEAAAFVNEGLARIYATTVA